jgi:hypothetical protein
MDGGQPAIAVAARAACLGTPQMARGDAGQAEPQPAVAIVLLALGLIMVVVKNVVIDYLH